MSRSGKRSRVSLVPLSKQEKSERIFRGLRRHLIQTGQIPDPSTAEPHTEWKWVFRGQSNFVKAYTKGEAKALIKKLLGIGKKGKLPACITVEKVKPNADIRESTGEDRVGTTGGGGTSQNL